MKQIFKFAMLFAVACTLSTSFTACSDDDDDEKKEIDVDNANDLDYNKDYAEQWANYMTVVSSLLKTDATNLYNYWSNDANDQYATSYAKIFINHNSEDYASAISCVEAILDGCTDIASEVGASKIGEPYNLWSTDRTAALYAVESWYSWHSRDDYRNNIFSIRNAYYGSRDGSVNPNSLSAILNKVNPSLDAEAKEKIQAAANAIYAIPQPFRNNINSTETKAAMEACGDLESFIDEELKPYFVENINDDATLDPAISQYVNGVVLPTYKELVELNTKLDDAVKTFRNNPSDANFAACASAWLAARAPWEMSEAFLFGPVADKGLDPNMDSWPLDQSQIAQILKSQDFSGLNWDGEYVPEAEDEEEEADMTDAQKAQAKKIADAQSLRGFHTLEYLVFKDGKARTTK